MFLESNLQHRKINERIIRVNDDHMHHIVIDVWILEDLRGYLCTREVVLSCNIAEICD